MKARMEWSIGKHTVKVVLRLCRIAALCHALLLTCFPAAGLPTLAGCTRVPLAK